MLLQTRLDEVDVSSESVFIACGGAGCVEEGCERGLFV